MPGREDPDMGLRHAAFNPPPALRERRRLIIAKSLRNTVRKIHLSISPGSVARRDPSAAHGAANA